MTWVIGMPGLVTRGVLIGDTRITLRYPDGRTRECEGVQKIHSVAANIAMGFAGNIDTGFKMVGDFARFMRNSVPDGQITHEPSRAIFKWTRRARYHWNQTLAASEREGGCSLIFVAALPPTGPFTPTVGYTLEAPGFAPSTIPTRTARSIGSGAQVPEYLRELERLADDHELFQFETMYWDHVGGAGMAVSIAISDAIAARAVGGISPHLHICSVRFGTVEIRTNDQQALTAGIESRIMPPVAVSWHEWLQWKADNAVAEGIAVASAML